MEMQATGEKSRVASASDRQRSWKPTMPTILRSPQRRCLRCLWGQADHDHDRRGHFTPTWGCLGVGHSGSSVSIVYSRVWSPSRWYLPSWLKLHAIPNLGWTCTQCILRCVRKLHYWRTGAMHLIAPPKDISFGIAVGVATNLVTNAVTGYISGSNGSPSKWPKESRCWAFCFWVVVSLAQLVRMLRERCVTNRRKEKVVSALREWSNMIQPSHFGAVVQDGFPKQVLIRGSLDAENFVSRMFTLKAPVHWRRCSASPWLWFIALPRWSSLSQSCAFSALLHKGPHFDHSKTFLDAWSAKRKHWCCVCFGCIPGLVCWSFLADMILHKEVGERLYAPFPRKRSEGSRLTLRWGCLTPHPSPPHSSLQKMSNSERQSTVSWPEEQCKIVVPKVSCQRCQTDLFDLNMR